MTFKARPMSRDFAHLTRVARVIGQRYVEASPSRRRIKLDDWAVSKLRSYHHIRKPDWKHGDDFAREYVEHKMFELYAAKIGMTREHYAAIFTLLE